MIRNISLILKIVTHLSVGIVVLLGFYYLKYRPVRNEYQQLKAVNKQLVKEVEAKDVFISTLWDNYTGLAKIPRYTIDQHLDRIKVKRNSTLEFLPKAELRVLDSLGNSPIIKDTILQKDANKYRQHWWQIWKPNKRTFKNHLNDE